MRQPRSPAGRPDPAFDERPRRGDMRFRQGDERPPEGDVRPRQSEGTQCRQRLPLKSMASTATGKGSTFKSMDCRGRQTFDLQKHGSDHRRQRFDLQKHGSTATANVRPSKAWIRPPTASVRPSKAWIADHRQRLPIKSMNRWQPVHAKVAGTLWLWLFAHDGRPGIEVDRANSPVSISPSREGRHRRVHTTRRG